MTDPLRQVGTRLPTPQSEPARSDQVQNSAGGYGFSITPLQRARRFVILGAQGSSYYASERELTKQNASVVIDLASRESTGLQLVTLIRQVSLGGRAPRQNATLFSLAACLGSPEVNVRRAAKDAVSEVCRTGTQLFQFLGYADQFRGHGRLYREAVRSWYLDKPVGRLAYQAVKYRQRERWSHRHVLREFRPKAPEEDRERRRLFDWICHPESSDPHHLPPVVEGFIAAQNASSAPEWCRLVAEYRLPWEALPDAALREPQVWEAMLLTMGLTAMIRNLGRMTELGVLVPGSPTTDFVAHKLTDPIALKEGRVHPLKVLVALSTYAAGHGLRGKLNWAPVGSITDALNDSFYAAFGSVQPAGKRFLVAVDVSPSMASGCVAGSSLSPRKAAAALAMVTVATEPACSVVAFAGGSLRSRESAAVQPWGMSARQRLDDVVRSANQFSWSATDCALPIIYATREGLEIDCFLTITDNETWSGYVHPHQALQRYREKLGIVARNIVIAMTATNFSIARPDDPDSLDCVGMDSATPEIVRGFAAREF